MKDYMDEAWGLIGAWFDSDPDLPKLRGRVAAALRAAREDGLEEAAQVVANACLVPPDGGSPTEAERAVAEAAATAIRALKGGGNG